MTRPAGRLTVVGAGTGIGGASVAGTLSCGTLVISAGQRCLPGANSGPGISLGDDCIAGAGLYQTAGAIVALPSGQQAKARGLGGQSGLLFRRNSITRSVEALTRQSSCSPKSLKASYFIFALANAPRRYLSLTPSPGVMPV